MSDKKDVDDVKEDAKPAGKPPVDLNAAIHLALDRAERAEKKVDLLERKLEARDVLPPPVLPVKGEEKKKSGWDEFVSGFMGENDAPSDGAA